MMVGNNLTFLNCHSSRKERTLHYSTRLVIGRKMNKTTVAKVSDKTAVVEHRTCFAGYTDRNSLFAANLYNFGRSLSVNTDHNSCSIDHSIA